MVGYPGAVFPVFRPASVGGEGQPEPDRDAQRAGQMEGGVIDGHHEVQSRNLGGEPVDVGGLFCGAIDKYWRAGRCGLLFEVAVSVADPADVGEGERRSEGGEVNREFATGLWIPGLSGEANQAAAVGVSGAETIAGDGVGLAVGLGGVDRGGLGGA